MKKIKIDQKLKLNKNTVAKLNDLQMNTVFGGEKITFQTGITCPKASWCWACNAVD
jgi:natural product precursor